MKKKIFYILLYITLYIDERNYNQVFYYKRPRIYLLYDDGGPIRDEWDLIYEQ